jgi:ParB/RepB/Spo0J family partition protein
MSTVPEESSRASEPARPAIALVDDGAAAPGLEVLELALEAIHPHPDNPRHFRADIEEESLVELAASIKAVGVLEPILVRRIPAPLGPLFQLVAGERRWRACRLAGLTSVPAIVRDLSDAEALEVLVVENLQREDLSPLQEARGVKALVDHGGWRLEDVADRLGRSVAWVAGRARLNSLSEAWRALVEDPKSWAAQWPVGHLLLVARLEPAGQDGLLADMAHTYNRNGLTFGDLKRMVSDRTRHLRQAPWKVADGALVPEAGPCTACLSRSSANPGLFEDLDSDNLKRTDRCLDPTCWAKKLAAHLEAKAAELRGTHGEVVEVSKSWDARDQKPGRLRDYQVEECRKDAKGAKPCLVVAGEGAGRMYWGIPRVDPATTNSRGGRAIDPQTGKPVQKSLKERQEDLRRRRIARAVKALLEQADVADPPKPASYLVALVAVFGTHGNAQLRGVSYAPWLDEGHTTSSSRNLHLLAMHFSDGKPEDLAELLWRKQVLPVLKKRLEYYSSCNIDELWSEAKAFASIIGADAATELELATQRLKEPKAWASLNDDGTPRGVAEPQVGSRNDNTPPPPAGGEPDHGEGVPRSDAAGSSETDEGPTAFAYLQPIQGSEVGRALFVSDGISQGKSWATYWRKASGSLARLRSPNLPERVTREEAQDDLDTWAEARGLELCCRG